jgi:uncharacterized membrane protein YcaP (DUF421 family)
MSIPWWEFIVRAFLVFFFLLVSLRLSGSRQIGQFAPFDLILLLVLSNAVQNSMNGGDNSLVGGLISALTLIILNHGLAFVSTRNKIAEKFIEGQPLILIHNGKPIEKLLHQENISHQDLERVVRQAGLNHFSEVQLAILETNGAISIIAKSKT